MFTCRNRQGIATIAAVQLLLLSPTLAADRITFVVPFSIGGPADAVPRMVAAKMSESMGNVIVIDNRPGAGGNVGAAAVANAKPDGNTLLAFAGGVLTVNPYLNAATPFTAKSFVPIVDFASTPNVLVVKSNAKMTNVKEMIALASEKPDVLTYSTPGVGTSPHLCMEMIASLEKVKLVHVPFKGGAEAINDVVAGRVDIACSNMLPALPFIKDGRLRALAITSKERSRILPDVPTVADTIPGFEVLGWYGLAAPAGTPKPIIDRLNTEAVNALHDPEIGKRLQDLGLLPIGDSPDEFSKYIGEEAARWSDVVRNAKLNSK